MFLAKGYSTQAKRTKRVGVGDRALAWERPWVDAASNNNPKEEEEEKMEMGRKNNPCLLNSHFTPGT